MSRASSGSGRSASTRTDRGGASPDRCPGVGKWGARRIRWHGRLAAHWRLGDHGLAGHRRRGSLRFGVGVGSRLAHCRRTARSRQPDDRRGKVGAVDAHDAPRSPNCRWSPPIRSRATLHRPTRSFSTRMPHRVATLREVRDADRGDVDDGAVDELDVEHQPPTEHREHLGGSPMTVGSGVGGRRWRASARRRRRRRRRAWSGVGTGVGVGTGGTTTGEGNRRDGGLVGTTGRAVGCGTRDTVGTPVEDRVADWQRRRTDGRRGSRVGVGGLHRRCRGLGTAGASAFGIVSGVCIPIGPPCRSPPRQ